MKVTDMTDVTGGGRDKHYGLVMDVIRHDMTDGRT